MDKHLLVEEAIGKLKDDFEKQGLLVEEYRMIPTYVGFRTFPVRLGLVIPNAQWPSLMEKVDFIVERKHAVLTDEERRLIGSIFIYPTADAMNEDMDERLGLHLVVSDW